MDEMDWWMELMAGLELEWMDVVGGMLRSEIAVAIGEEKGQKANRGGKVLLAADREAPAGSEGSGGCPEC